MSLQTRLAAFVAAVGADIKAIKTDQAAGAFYQKLFGVAWPTNVAGTFRDHPDGMQTYVLPATGTYKVTLTDTVKHTGPYTYENTNWGLNGGTATRLDNGGTFDTWLPSSGQDGNRSSEHTAYFYGTAGQTIQFNASFRMGSAVNDNTKHEFSFSAVIEMVSSRLAPMSDPSAMARVRRDAAFGVPNNTLHPVTWDVEETDFPGGMWSPAQPTRMYATKSGPHVIVAQCGWPSGNVAGRDMIIAKGGNPNARIGDEVAVSFAADPLRTRVTTVHWLNAGEYIEMYLYHNLGVGQTQAMEVGQTFFMSMTAVVGAKGDKGDPGLPNPQAVAFHAVRNTILNLGEDAWLPVPFDNELYDLGSCYDGTKFTAPAAGVYTFTFGAVTKNGNQPFYIGMEKQGSSTATVQLGYEPVTTQMNATHSFYLNVGDTVRPIVYFENASQGLAASTSCFFEGRAAGEQGPAGNGFGAPQFTADFDAAMNPGLYRGNGTGRPTTTDGPFFVQTFDTTGSAPPGDRLQIAYATSGQPGRYWMRLYSSGAWGAWASVGTYPEDQIVLPYKTGAGTGNWRRYTDSVNYECKYYRDRRRVYLSGIAETVDGFGFANNNSFIATLPAGYRPLKTEYFAIPLFQGSSKSLVRLVISTNGDMRLDMDVIGGAMGSPNTYVFLDGISFRANY